MYILFLIINRYTNDTQSTEILLGIDYKTFTLGLGEFYRLLTSGFCHFSFIHLFCNMVSLFSLGGFIEALFGTKKYLLILFSGILLGSLTSGNLNNTVFQCGISSALYSFLVIFILFIIVYRQPVSQSFFPLIFLNMTLNFMPNIAWEAHLGGAVAGLMFFFIDYYERTKNIALKRIMILLTIFTFVSLSVKYYYTKDSIDKYYGTDNNFVSYTKEYFPFISQHYENKIYNYYIEKR